MTAHELSRRRLCYVLVKTRSFEHAEAVATELAARGLPVACVDVPAAVDVCLDCSRMRVAQRTAVGCGVLTAACMGLVTPILLALILRFI